MRVLLLGATGNLGSRCVPALLAHNHVLTIFVRNPAKLKSIMSPAILERLESIVVGDVTDSPALEKAIRDHNIEGIIDVAGNQVLPWKEFLLPKIAKAVSDAAITVGKERKVPLRVWVTAGLGVMQKPGKPNLIQESLPGAAFDQHNATRKIIEPISVADLRWSLFCVAMMYPLDPKQKVMELLEAPRPHNLLLGKTFAPGWKDTWWNNIPIIGYFINVMVVVLTQYNTKLEAAADFLAEDLEKDSGEFVGSKVGMKEKPKLKAA